MKLAVIIPYFIYNDDVRHRVESDVIVVAAESTTSWLICYWRRRGSSVTYFSIVDVGAVDSERPLMSATSPAQRHMQSPF